jgi:hypothetical protein
MEELVVPLVDQVKSKYVAPMVENVAPMMENVKEKLYAKEKQLEKVFQNKSPNTSGPLFVISLLLIVMIITLLYRWQRRRHSKNEHINRLHRTERWKKFVREHTHEQPKEEEEEEEEIVFVPASAAVGDLKDLPVLQAAETSSLTISSKSEPEAENKSTPTYTTTTTSGTPMIVRRSRRLSEKVSHLYRSFKYKSKAYYVTLYRHQQSKDLLYDIYCILCIYV